jgi:hypothetical protein
LHTWRCPWCCGFCRLRNFFKAEDDEVFETLSEYTSGSRVTAARNRFYQRRVKMLLYTERAHFYKRYRIRGVRVCDEHCALVGCLQVDHTCSATRA